jgi:hypothetical protein
MQFDYSGDNNGIRERPASFVEGMASQGNRTHLMGRSAGKLIGMSIYYLEAVRLHVINRYVHLVNMRKHSHSTGSWSCAYGFEGGTVLTAFGYHR